MSQTTEMPPPDTARLLVVSGICSFGDGSTDIPIDKTPFVLGRWEKCDGVVKPLEVSRKHCEIVKAEGAYRLRDLGSTNKTFLNDQEVGQVAKSIGHMDTIRLGNGPGVVLRFVTQTVMSPRKVFVIDTKKREVRINGDLKELTAKEFDLLAHLHQHKGVVCSKEELLESSWSGAEPVGDYAITANNLQQHIRNIRKKIEQDPHNPKFIVTKPSVGYMLNVY